MNSSVQKRVFRSKIGFVIGIPIVVCCGVAFTAWYASGLLLFPLLITGFGILVTLAMFNTTYTITTGNRLKVIHHFIKVDVDINTIRKIQPTNSVTNALALSFDKIAIDYNRYDTLVISPKDKQEFIALLRSINPLIEVSL